MLKLKVAEVMQKIAPKGVTAILIEEVTFFKLTQKVEINLLISYQFWFCSCLKC